MLVSWRVLSMTRHNARSTSSTPCPLTAERRLLCGALDARDLLLDLLSRERIGFIEHNDFRLFGEAMTVGRQLGAHGSIGGAGIFAGTIDEMQ